MKLILYILFLFPIIGFGQVSAFISGNELVCDYNQAEVEVSFISGLSPYTFIYAINGITQSSITTNDNPYAILTQQEGVYTLTYFSDANTNGSINGSAIVTVLESPTALFTTSSDTLSVLYPSVQLNDFSIGNIVAWTWDFGDNTANDYTSSPYHIYPQWPTTVYQVSLIVIDNVGCSDTASSTITVGQLTTSIEENTTNKELLKVTDLLGRETKDTKNEVLFYIYDDGTVEKKIILE